MKLMPFAALLLATSALPAMAGEVLMLDHNPSVEELRGYLTPDSPRRTRSVEVLAQPATPAMPTTKAAATMETPTPAPAPTPEPMMAPGSEKTAPEKAAAPAPAKAATKTPKKKAAKAPAPAQEPTTIGYHIQFAYDSADIQPESRSFLDQLGQVLQSEPNLALAVEGHTDAHGGDAYNMTLSQHRAAAVQSYLSTVWHVPAERLTVSGKGKSEPLTADPFAAENRRVQFRPLS